MIRMGEKATDRITGYTGTVIARIDYLNGSVQYQLQAEGLHEGSPVKAQWFEQERLEDDA